MKCHTGPVDSKIFFQVVGWNIVELQQGDGLYDGPFTHMDVFTGLNPMSANEEDSL